MEVWEFSDFFWQYPVITEQQIAISLKKLGDQQLLSKTTSKVIYLAIPWATIIDQHIYHPNKLVQSLRSFIQKVNVRQGEASQMGTWTYVTSCQHIYFVRIIPVLKQMMVTYLFASHKKKGVDIIDGINIKPLQLYAVNFEDPKRNQLFQQIGESSLLTVNRCYLYSFIGYYDRSYISRIRQQIFTSRHPANCLVKNTRKWHFVNVIYRQQVPVFRKMTAEETVKENLLLDQETIFYNQTLINSRFSLCPSGTGPNSIRFWESLACGAIPVLLSDQMVLPDIPSGLSWNEVIISIPENEYQLLLSVLEKVTPDTETKMRQKCLDVYQEFSKDNFALHCYGINSS